MTSQLPRIFLLSLASCFVTLPAVGAIELDSQKVDRLLTGWKDYEGIRISGFVLRHFGGKDLPKSYFEVCTGRSTSPKQLRPKSIAIKIDNPGEPHVNEPRIISFAWATDGEFSMRFKRSFITLPNPAYRMNEVYITPKTRVTQFADCPVVLHGIDFAMHPSYVFGGNLDQGFGFVSEIKRRDRFEWLGTETFLGLEAQRIRFTYGGEDGSSVGVSFEFLACLEPTPLVLKLISVTTQVESKRARIDNFNRKLVAGHRLLEVRLCDGKLIPWVTAFGDASNSNKVRIEVTHVEQLPIDEAGLWEMNRPSGTWFLGDAEPAIRQPGIHLTEKGSAGSYIPYTDGEEEAIRQYLIAQNVPMLEPGIAWQSLLFYASSLVSLIGLSLVIYHKVKGAA